MRDSHSFGGEVLLWMKRFTFSKGRWSFYNSYYYNCVVLCEWPGHQRENHHQISLFIITINSSCGIIIITITIFMPATKRTRNKLSRDYYDMSNMTTNLQLSPFSCQDLIKCLESSSSSSDHHILVLDCRPFLIHNDSHITNSINIHCPPIIR